MTGWFGCHAWQMEERKSGHWADLSALPAAARGQHHPGVQFVCDGETFEVGPGAYGGTHYAWLSGPNSDYGFTTSGSVDDVEQHQANVRWFLSMIDPETGYIEEE